MSSVNLPASLFDMFQAINDRINRLELGYNGPQASADAAQSTATSAQSTAANASAQALLAQSQATIASSQATQAQTSANGKNTILYGTSATPPAGTYKQGDIYYQYDGSNHIKANLQYNGSSWANAPFTQGTFTSLDAGAITTGTLSAIEISAGSGGTAFHVSPSGVMSAQGVYVKGDIHADSGSFTGSIYASAGTIGGFTITSNDYLQYGTTYIYGNSTYSAYAMVDISREINFAGLVINGSGSTSIRSSAGGINMGGTAHFGGNLEVVSMSSTSGTTVVYSSSNNRFYLSSSTERHKDNIAPIPAADYLSKILELEPVTFNYKPEYTDTPDKLISGLIAESVAAIPEFTTVVNYDKDNLPESIAYDRLAVFLIPAIKQINDRLTKLEGK
jgi:hypothetical protein